ncbi:hypothetical protein [Mesorhizobium sp. CAU 1732]
MAFKAQSPSRRFIDNSSILANTARPNSAPRATNHDIAGLPFTGKG